MILTLKNNRTTQDPRLDRVPQYDERSRLYGVINAVPAGTKPRSYTWRCMPHYDQGTEGACVGFGITHELAARPNEVTGLSAKFARERIYWEAQRIDGWPGGAYPGALPRYEGTAVLAGLKVAVRDGWWDGYKWAFGLDELIIGVGHYGPAILGVKWYDGMRDTDDKGFIWPSGHEIGGHCILCKAVHIGPDATRSWFVLHNSWGAQWGNGGDCRVTFDAMHYLLKDEGEAAFAVGRHTTQTK